MKMVRSALAIVGGLFAGFFLILAGETLGQRIYPPPAWLKIDDPESLAAALKIIPPGALALVLVWWAIGTFMAAGIAARIAPQRKILHGMAIGCVFLLASIMNMSMFPHPLWFWVLGLLEFLPLAYLGAKLVTLGDPKPSSIPEP